jgi:hypothetical protein
MTEKECDIIDRLGITLTFKFIPFSQSCNKEQKNPSLNYLITLQKSGKDFLTTNYSMGCGHCPSYHKGKLSIDEWDEIKLECEYGRKIKVLASGNILKGKEIKPDIKDVLYSILSDSSVLDFGTFEEWADCMEYDSDSRKAEKIYRNCLEIGLKMRNGIGEDGLKKLKEVFEGY